MAEEDSRFRPPMDALACTKTIAPRAIAGLLIPGAQAADVPADLTIPEKKPLPRSVARGEHCVLPILPAWNARRPALSIFSPRSL